MAGYIAGDDRGQLVMFPEMLDDYIDAENPVRLFDAFAEGLDLIKCGFTKAVPAKEGAPAYSPRDLLKLYFYGYFNGIRGSRKLMRECGRNVEVMWLMGRLRPDFRTISGFRKDNKKALKGAFKEFNRYCDSLGLYGKDYIAIDGSKFKAWNSKDRNLTLAKLDDRLKRIEENISAYLKQAEEQDEKEGKEEDRGFSKEEIEKKIKELQERKERYEGYRDTMEKAGESQISLTDTESRLMKFKEGFEVGYNVQTAVDAKAHLIADFEVTDHATDHGLLAEVAGEVKKELGVKTIESVADKGYDDKEDMVRCLERGIVPNVFPAEGKDGFELETEYESGEIKEEERASEEEEDIKKCLRAGVIPEVYKGIVSDIRVEEKTTYEIIEDKREASEAEAGGETGLSEEELAAQAAEGYYVRDINRNLVYCPCGSILRQKTEKKNGTVRYWNKLACQNCPRKCTKAKCKTVDFAPGARVAECKAYTKEKKDSSGEGSVGRRGKRVKKTVKVVRFHFKVDRKKLDNRKCLAEHPFGTVKRALHSSYVLLKGKAKVTGELSLVFLAYNMKRAINTLGVRKMVAALAN